MLANIKKTALATAIIATATTGFASVATAAERSELTIHPKEFTTFVRNFNPFFVVHRYFGRAGQPSGFHKKVKIPNFLVIHIEISVQRESSSHPYYETFCGCIP